MRAKFKSRLRPQVTLTILLLLSFFCCFITIESKAREKENRRRVIVTTPRTIMATPSLPIRYYKNNGKAKDYDNDSRNFGPNNGNSGNTAQNYGITKYSGSAYGSAYKSLASSTDAENGLCSRRREMKLMCYCYPDDKILPAERAECWVISDGLSKNDSTWNRFYHTSTLRELKFVVQNNARLEFIPSMIFQPLINLTVMTIEFAQIETVHKNTFGTLLFLEQIHLPNNQIEVLGPDSFSNFIRLRELNLEYNQIFDISNDTFRNLPLCERMYLAHNNISDLLANTFAEMPRLAYLDVSHNHVAILKTDMFKGLGNLHVLRFGFNRISFIGDAVFIELWSLDELDLNNNQIERISERALDGLNNLRVLNIRSNNLKALDLGLLRGTPALHVLKIENNALESLSSITFQPIMDNLVNGTSEISVTDNNFICDCRLAWLFDLRNQTRHNVLRESLEEFTCVIYNPTIAMFIEPIPKNVLEIIRKNKRKHDTKRKNQLEEHFDAFAEMQLNGNHESVSIQKRTLKNSHVSNEASNSASYQDPFYQDESQDVSLLSKLYNSDESVFNLKNMNTQPINSNNLDIVTDLTSTTTISTATHPHNDTGIKIRLFMLKPDHLPCTPTHTDPTELPLSRDLMYRGNFSINSSYNTKRLFMQNFSMTTFLFLACLYAYFLVN